MRPREEGNACPLGECRGDDGAYESESEALDNEDETNDVSKNCEVIPPTSKTMAPKTSQTGKRRRRASLVMLRLPKEPPASQACKSKRQSAE